MTRISDRRAACDSAFTARTLVACLPAFFLAACSPPAADPPDLADRPVLVSDGRYAMGTVLEFTLVSSDERADRGWIEEGFSRVAALEKLFSSHDPDSQISRLNAMAGSGPQKVDRRVAELLELALHYSSVTRGGFDVSVAPLIQLWRTAVQRQRAPSAEELLRARALVGADAMRLDRDGSIELAAGAAIDLGAIAKGYALDRLAADLRDRGSADALLSFGQSSVRALGSPPGEEGWRLLLRTPGGGFAGFVTLRDHAFSVSSSLSQWTLIEGKRYGHVVDPRSGQPVARGLQAAVIGPTAAGVEALSTALIVLGEVEGVALVESIPDTEAMFVDDSGAAASTRGWQRASGFESLDSIEASDATELDGAD